MKDIALAEVQQADEQALDALLQRAVDPQVPVQIFYALLERIEHAAATWRPPHQRTNPGAHHDTTRAPTGQQAAQHTP